MLKIVTAQLKVQPGHPSENTENIIVQSDIDGGLIGGASLKVDKFYEIINKVDEIIKKEDNN